MGKSKRKRNKEGKIKEKEKESPKNKDVKDYKVKYIGESSRSAYERGKEHFNAFRDIDEQSHILKHFLLVHEGMEMKDLKFGIRITGNYRTAIERQISEAVKIEREIKKGKKILTSKSEFNRCEIPRLNASSKKDALNDLKEEHEETKRLKIKMRQIRKRKKDKRIEDEMKNPSIERVCIEILNDDNRQW